jgi:hypothetical protein
VPEAVIRQLVLPESRAPNAGSSLRWVVTKKHESTTSRQCHVGQKWAGETELANTQKCCQKSCVAHAAHLKLIASMLALIIRRCHTADNVKSTLHLQSCCAMQGGC